MFLLCFCVGNKSLNLRIFESIYHQTLTIRVGGYTDISKFSIFDEAIADEFNDLGSRHHREPALRESWKNIMLEKPAPFTPEIRKFYVKRQECSRKVLDHGIEKFCVECLDSSDATICITTLTQTIKMDN